MKEKLVNITPPPADIAGKNKLFYGDNLDVLRKIKDETIDLCYIDPPFNSKRNYNQIYKNIGQDVAQAQAFIDTWTWDTSAELEFQDIISNEHGAFTIQTIELLQGLSRVLKKGSLFAYLVSMTGRIAEIYRVLKSTGSFYLHCDPNASHYLKIIVDSIFCSQTGEYQNEIIWRRTGQHNKVTRYGPIHDVILFYTKSENYTWNFPKRPFMQGHIDENFIKDEKGYRTNYYGNVLTGSGIRGGESGQTWKGFNPTPKNRHWAIPGALLTDLDEDLSDLTQHQKLDRLFELGFITITEGEMWPIYNRYLTPADGQAVPDIWAFQPYTSGTVFKSKEGIDEDVRWLSTKDKERLGYPTQKPEGLLERIIAASTNEGDVVLDAYCGCGTTVAVAQRLNRAWVGIDITYQSISVILKRMQDLYGESIMDSIELSGVPRDIESAKALAHKKEDKTRKEFEKWSILSYCIKAMINEKKGADGGIDGRAMISEATDKSRQVIFSVKSGGVGVDMIRDLCHVVEREEAAMGIFITLENPSKPMIAEAKGMGIYVNPWTNQSYEKIKIVTVEDIIKGERLSIPTMRDSLKTAEAQSKDIQHKLDL